MYRIRTAEMGRARRDRNPARSGAHLHAIRHDALFPVKTQSDREDVVLGAHRNPMWAASILAGAFQSRVDGMVRHVGPTGVADMVRGKKALPALACPLEAVVGVTGDGHAYPTLISFLHTVRLDWEDRDGLDDEATLAVLRDINDGLAVGREQARR